MKVAVTGADGFLGWHVRVRLLAEHGIQAVSLGREHLADPEQLAAALAEVDTVIHLAGVNRADRDDEVEQGNEEIARTLAAAIADVEKPLHVVFGNSVQAELDNPYGRGKQRAAALLHQATAWAGGTLADVLLPNLFGEHGRPHYNSFVATFCHEVAHGRQPTVTSNRDVGLLHAQGAAAAVIDAAKRRQTEQVRPNGETRSVAEVLELLNDFHDKYGEGQIPDIATTFATDLFNTYRSFLFPDHFPFRASVNADPRGELFEAMRCHGGGGQTFVSTTVPGVTRGEHFHLRKVERFFVLKGTAEIALRRVHCNEVIRFQVKAGDRSFVDMPTMWVHNITNVGDDELMTLFWTDQLLNPDAPDTYWEPVEGGRSSA